MISNHIFHSFVQKNIEVPVRFSVTSETQKHKKSCGASSALFRASSPQSHAGKTFLSTATKLRLSFPRRFSSLAQQKHNPAFRISTRRASSYTTDILWRDLSHVTSPQTNLRRLSHVPVKRVEGTEVFPCMVLGRSSQLRTGTGEMLRATLAGCTPTLIK